MPTGQSGLVCKMAPGQQCRKILSNNEISSVSDSTGNASDADDFLDPNMTSNVSVHLEGIINERNDESNIELEILHSCQEEYGVELEDEDKKTIDLLTSLGCAAVEEKQEKEGEKQTKITNFFPPSDGKEKELLEAQSFVCY